MQVSRMTIWKLEQKYELYGDSGLKNFPTGRPFEPLNQNFYDLVIKEWRRNRCGARKLYQVMKRKGFSVSLRKISQVMIKEGLQKPCPKRQLPRKYKRYEWPIPNFMWHTDWHRIKAEKLFGQNILVYIDDCTRKIMSYIIGNQTAQNSLFALYGAIAKNKVTPFCLNSDRGTHFFPNKRDKNGNAIHVFQQGLEELGIKFIPSKVRHPQTNGKNERFFGILDSEFDNRFATIDVFIEWYNTKRLSEAIDYLTPNEAYKKRL